MNDRHPKDLLSAYLDGEVTTAERIEVARHLEVCVECRGVLDDFRTMAAAASQEPPPPVPPGLQARIMAALQTRSPEPRRRFAPWFPVPLAVAAGVVVVATAGWLLLRPRSGSEPMVVARSTPESQPPQRAAAGEAPGDRSDAEAPAQKTGSEEAYRVPAPSPPPASVEPFGKDASDSLRALGYTGRDRQSGVTAKQKPIGAAPELTGDRPASPEPQFAAPEPARSTAPSGFDAASETTEAGRSEGAAAPPTLAFHEAAGKEPAARSLVFEFEGAAGTLTEAGLVTLSRERGTCSVDLSGSRATGDEVRFIFSLVAATPEPRAGARGDEARPQERLREAGRAAGAAAVGALEDKDGRRVRLLRVLPPARRPLDPAGLERVEERLRRLLDVTASEALAARCGDPPARSPQGE